MVKIWDKRMQKGIKITKFRIQHHEKHGAGKNAMEEKQILLKQEKKYKEYKLKK